MTPGEADIVCPDCGSRNRVSSKFCSDCGSRIDGVCPNCGNENRPGARFCNACGHRVADVDEAVAHALSDTPSSEIDLCPRCLGKTDPGSQFCYHCGLPLQGEAALRSPRASRAFESGTPGGFWLRVFASIIDWIVLLVVIVVVNTGATILVLYDERPWVALLIYTAWPALCLLYAPVLIGIWETTVGKRCFKLYVVRSDGNRCGFWRALFRTFATIVSGLILFIGYLMVAARQDKRALHDLIADTAVIRR